MITPLSPSLTKQVLAYLGVTAVPVEPDVQLLDLMMHAYCRKVPWESASRIVRRTAVAEQSARPRWPEQFWQEAMTNGTGGTCFESNGAYLALLTSLGFEGYLTLNNMGDTIGCHSAIVILWQGQKWLVDAGYPLYATLPSGAAGIMQRSSQFLHYRVRPDGRDRYQIEQWPHPNRVAYTLIDEPVSEAAYRARTIADYGQDGLFLDAVIINKIVGNEPWRFNMRERPWALNRFNWGKRTNQQLNGDPALAVAYHFGIDEAIVTQAFKIAISKHE